MLLSQDYIHDSPSTQHDIEKQKHGRIMAFIYDQKNHLSGYKSPNHYSKSEQDNLPLVEEGGDAISLLSASVSQINSHRRKHNPVVHNQPNGSFSTKSGRQRKKKRASYTQESTRLPQNNSHAFHLLQVNNVFNSFNCEKNDPNSFFLKEICISKLGNQ